MLLPLNRVADRMDDGSENPEIVSKFEKLDFLSLWKGREKVNQVEKQILSLFLKNTEMHTDT